MKQVKLKSKNGKDGIKVPVNKGYVAVDRKGFISVEGHPLHIQKMNVDYLELYYDLPDGIKLP